MQSRVTEWWKGEIERGHVVMFVVLEGFFADSASHI